MELRKIYGREWRRGFKTSIKIRKSKVHFILHLCFIILGWRKRVSSMDELAFLSFRYLCWNTFESTMTAIIVYFLGDETHFLAILFSARKNSGCFKNTLCTKLYFVNSPSIVQRVHRVFSHPGFRFTFTSVAYMRQSPTKFKWPKRSYPVN